VQQLHKTICNANTLVDEQQRSSQFECFQRYLVWLRLPIHITFTGSDGHFIAVFLLQVSLR